MKRLATTLAALGLFGITSTIQAASNAREAYERIIQQGYIAPYELAYRHGLWTASATNFIGRPVQLLLDGQKLSAIDPTELKAGVLSAADIRASLRAQGYSDIDDIELDDGLWTAEVREVTGNRLDLWLHPLTGNILHAVRKDGLGAPANTLDITEIQQALTNSGYTQLRELEFDNGYWEADARNARGQRVELVIDPLTGTVLREKLDD